MEGVIQSPAPRALGHRAKVDKPTSLFDIPLELRRKIYKLLLTADTAHSYSQYPNEPGISLLRHGIDARICRANKQIYAEATNVMKTANHLLEILSDDPNMNTHIIMYNLGCVCVKRGVGGEVEPFKHVTLRITASTPDIWDGECYRDIHRGDKRVKAVSDTVSYLMVHQNLPLALLALQHLRDSSMQYLPRPTIISAMIKDQPLDMLDVDQAQRRAARLADTVLKPLLTFGRGWTDLTLTGLADSQLEQQIIKIVKGPRYTEPRKVLDSLLQLKATANEHYKAGRLYISGACYSAIRRELSEWLLIGRQQTTQQLVKDHGLDIALQVANLYFNTALNAVASNTAQIGKMARRHSNNAEGFAMMSKLSLGHLKNATVIAHMFKLPFKHTQQQLAKLLFREAALHYWADPFLLPDLSFDRAGTAIKDAARLAPHDAAVLRLQKQIEDQKKMEEVEARAWGLVL